MAELEAWRNRGNRDPLEIVSADQQRQLKKNKGCFACDKRQVGQGGDGRCKKKFKFGHGCGFQCG